MHVFLLDLTGYIDKEMAWIGIKGQRPYQSNKLASLFLILSYMAEGKYSMDLSQ
jgi:hypothetical protein